MQKLFRFVAICFPAYWIPGLTFAHFNDATFIYYIRYNRIKNTYNRKPSM